jgi:NTE family protein
MTRALVLGGGGPVGIGWQAGLMVGLVGAGVDVEAAEAVIGTSAGSVVGFTLAAGIDLSEAVALVGTAAGAGGADDAAGVPAGQGIEQLISSLAEAAGDPDASEQVRARLGRMALDAPTIPEEQWLALFDSFKGAPWPDRFSCTAVDAGDGRFKVWTASDGVDPRLAIASSCTVPTLYPPVTIGGRRWIDGGVRDMLNADVAAGHQTVLAVSCMLLDIPPEFSTPVFDAVLGATRAQIDGLRDSGAKVEVVVPGAAMLEVSGFGLDLMNFSKVEAAYQAGVDQAEAEAARLAGFWAG